MKKNSTNEKENLETPMPIVSKTVHKLPFKELGGEGFERLVLAFLHEWKEWKTLQWLGETGKDQGRDIWAVDDERTYCYQCANYQKLTFKKVSEDIDKLFGNNLQPDNLIIVCGGSVPNTLRDRIFKYATNYSINQVEVWSGSEFEEKLRRYAFNAMLRFFHGEAFPKSGNETRKKKVLSAAETIPCIEISLTPSLQVNNSDVELSVFLEEAFYNKEKTIVPSVQISIKEESMLREKVEKLSKDQTGNRKQLLDLRKILDLITKIKEELAVKVNIMAIADLYPVKSDFQALCVSFRELLKLCFDIKILYGETELDTFFPVADKKEQALKFDGKWKIDVFRDFGGSTGFSIWLSDHEFDELKKRLPASVSPSDMWIFGFECSDLSQKTMVEKVIPAFIDKIYDLAVDNDISLENKNDWYYLPGYRLGVG
ncbi:hypothetical protein [Mucilaginibacter sp. CSA2-8R]|uniref:hypothetical protein n=1 Tax=Mucilaginibacter sp. CSA2-8R TaxID=3141542 RepID=UPI00315D6F0F